MDFTDLHWIEAVGWLASALTVATYSMNTMLPLRIFAIGSSLCFGIYAVALELWPLLAMELILLPINCYRFWQVLTLRGKLARAADGEADEFAVIRSYGKRRTIPSGTAIFSRGDRVEQLYLLTRGHVGIEEFKAEIVPGEIFGEIAFFTDSGTRIATARALDDVEVFELDRKSFMRLQFEDPSFGLSIMRTVTRRLAANGNLEIGN